MPPTLTADDAGIAGALLDALPASAVVIDQTGSIMLVNASWRSFAMNNGWPDKRCGVGENYLAVCERAATVGDTIARQVAVGLRELLDGSVDNFTREYPCHNKEERRWFRLIARPLKAGVLAGALILHHDITEHKDIEEKFLRAQRLQSVGALAGGIAHDFNNLLTPILMAVGLLKLMPGGRGEKETKMIATIESAAHHGAHLVRQILTFSRGVSVSFTRVDLRVPLREIAEIVSTTFPELIVLVQDIDENLGHVDGDTTQLEQILMNLVVNARDAMPKGGTLTLRARNARFSQARTVRGETFPAGDYVVLEVADTGTGMDATVLGRIFEPFFTTKEPGKGTGVGLATVNALVKAHRGYLEVESEPGKGTCFQVVLPVAQSEGTALNGQG